MSDAGPPVAVLEAAFPDRHVAVVGRLDGRATNGVHEIAAGRDRAVLKTTERAGWRLAKEAAILRELAPVAGVPVPELHGRGSAGGTDYLVTAFCEGTVAADAVGSGTARSVLESLGRVLARLHEAVPLDRPGTPVAGDDGLRVDGSGDWVGALRELLHEEARVLAGTPFESAVDRARSLLDDRGELVADPAAIRLLHADTNPGNEFVDGEGTITCVVDWEYAKAGDPSWDLAGAEWACLDAGPFDPADRDALLDGYAAVRAVPPGHGRRRSLYRALFVVNTMVGLAGGSEAERGTVAAPPERVQELQERFDRQVRAVRDR